MTPHSIGSLPSDIEIVALNVTCRGGRLKHTLCRSLRSQSGQEVNSASNYLPAKTQIMNTEHFKLHRHKTKLNRTDVEAPPAG